MRKRIFHHPVGIFPAGARWYLASIAVLSLLCVAMQLSIQIHAQKKAETVIEQWGHAAGVQVESVHYHLLRNALILRRIEVSRGDDFVLMEHMLLRANPALLTSQRPQIGRVEISGLEASLSHAGISNSWQQDEALIRLWQASSSLFLRDGTVSFYPQGEASPPLIFTGVSLEQQLKERQSILTIAASLGGSPVHWQWQTNRDKSPANGKLGWRDIDAGLITESFGLRPVAGSLTGYLNWIPSTDNQTQAIEGQVAMDSGDGVSGHLLEWQGGRSGGTWQLDITGQAWPLDAWADSLPKIGGRSLQSAQLDAALFLTGQPGAWKISSSQGDLHEITYREADNNDSPAWHWSRLSYENLQLDSGKHQLHASNVLLADANITLQAEQLPSADQSGEMQRLSGWRIGIDHIRATNIALELQLEQGTIAIESLQGSGNWNRDGLLNFELASAAGGQAAASEEAPATAAWQLQGHLGQQPGLPIEAALQVSARHVPLSRLRPLLPLTGSKAKPLTIGGNAEFEIEARVSRGIWQASGHASASDIHLSHGGDLLQVGNLSMKFGPLGMALPAQKIERLDIQGWHFITVLNPLPPLSSTPVMDAEAPERQQFWWAENLSRHNWQIDSTIWLGGTISLGNEDARWAEQVDLRLNHIQAGRWADIEIEGTLGSGEFALAGDWEVLGELNRFRGRASLHNALPFFLSNWMNISGMPRPLRGRLSAELSVSDSETEHGYNASLQVRLLRGLTRLGVFPSDPLLSRIGFNTKDTLALLNRGGDIAELELKLDGDWRESPLNIERIGQIMQMALHEKVRQQEHQIYDGTPDPASQEILIETRIRLHDGHTLSLNERIRLHKILRALRLDSGRVVDLVPNWSGKKMNPQLLARIQRTQQLIERYMAYRKIPRERIFPLWPTAEHQIKGIGSINVVVRQPRSSPE